MGDTISGTAGSTNNTLSLVDGYNQGVDIIPAGVSISNIQNIVLQTAGNAGSGGSPFNTAPYSSVTSTQVTSSGGVADLVQAGTGSTVALTHNATAGTATVWGGSNDTVTTSGAGVTVGGTGVGQLPTGTVTVNANGTGAGSAGTTVIGGTDVTVNVTQASATGNIKIGNIVGGVAGGALTAAYNPTGAITVTDADASALDNISVLGGSSVTVNSAGSIVTVGDATANTASNSTTGTVSVTQTMAATFNNLTGPSASDSNTAGGAIAVYGGSNVTVTANGGANITVGNDLISPTGTITVTDTASDQNAAYGLGGGGAGAIKIAGGTNDAVTAGGQAITIGVAVGVGTPNPSGTVTVTETQASNQAVTIDGGNGVNVAANGQAVNVGTNAGTAGAQVVTQSGQFTGLGLGSTNANSAVVVDGGSTVNISTTGGNVTVGAAGVGTPTGAVTINNTFSGAGTANLATANVVGGTTANITFANSTSGNVNVGVAPTLDPTGTLITNAANAANGNVTITNTGTSAGTTIYGASTDVIYTNTATNVTVAGATGGVTIGDIQAFKATGGTNNGKAIGTSTLTSVNLDGVGATTINSGALNAVTLADSTSTVTVGTIAGTWAAEGAHTMALTLNNDSGTAQLTDATATAITVTTAGSKSDTIKIVGAAATALTFNNSLGVTVTAASTMSNSGSAVDTITATGAGSLNLGNVTGWTGAAQISSISASSATGAVTAEINGNVTAFTGGAGNDVITVDTGASKTINGGAGTNEVIITNTAATYNPLLSPTAPISNDFTNFQTLGFGIATGGAAAVTGNYDVSGFSGVIEGAGALAGAVVLQNAGAAETLTIAGAPGNNATWELKTDAGLGHNATTITVGVDGKTTAGFVAGTVTTNAGGTLAAGTGISTVTVNSVGASTMTGSNTITLTDSHAAAAGNGTTALNVTGDAAVAVTSNDGTIATITVTGSGNTDVTAVTGPATGITITGGSGFLKVDTSLGSTTSSAVDTVTSGTGGVNVRLGTGGAGGGAATGSETVKLAANTSAGTAGGNGDIIYAPTIPGAAGLGTRGIVTGFHITGLGTDDALSFQAAKTMVANTATIAGATGSTYSVSDGVFTLLTAAGGLTPANELLDVQELVGGNKSAAFGGANNIGAVTILGTTYVIASDTLTTAGTITAADQTADTIIQLNGISGITGLGQASVAKVDVGGVNTIVAYNLNLLAAPNTGSNVAGSTNTYVDNGIAHDAMSVASATGITMNYQNMAAWAQLDLGGGATGGTVNVTQVGSTGDTLVLHSLAAAATLDSLTFNSDSTLVVDASVLGANTLELKSLVDGTNTVSTIYVTDGGNLAAAVVHLDSITDTALTTIDLTNVTNSTTTVSLGAATTPLTNDHLTILGGQGTATAAGNAEAVNIYASGAGDTLTLGDGANTIAANGAADVISVGTGTNTITANGANDTITIGTTYGAGGADASAVTIHTTGTGDTITFASTTLNGNAMSFSNAGNQVDGGSGTIGIGNNSTVVVNQSGVSAVNIVVTGDLTGATTSSGTISMTTVTNKGTLGDVHLTFDNLDVNSATLTETFLGQVNVAGASSLNAAFDLAASTAAMSNQQAGGTTDYGYIAAKSGYVDWFQYGGNTYIVEAINKTASAAQHTALGVGDQVIKITGLVDLSAATFTGHANVLYL